MIAPETAAHAAGTSALLPMLALGIPGSPTAAVLLGGLLIWGLQPGPLLFVEQKDFVWGLIASMYLGNIAGLIVVLTSVPLFASILRVPFAIIAPVIIAICAIGAYTVHNAMLDVWFMMGFGVIGYVFKKLDYPLAPLVLAVVLGDRAEDSFRQSMLLSQGEPDDPVVQLAGRLDHHLALLLLLWPFLAASAADAQGHGARVAHGGGHAEATWLTPRCSAGQILPRLLQARQRFGREIQVGRQLLLRQPLGELRVLAHEALHAARAHPAGAA